MPQITLDILIATYGPHGAARIAQMTLPQLPGVRYIATWQHHLNSPIPPTLLARPDIHIHRVNTLGLSANRNEALARTTADWYLIADDDLHYSPTGLSQLLTVMAANPHLDILTYRFDSPEPKTYPLAPTDITLPLPKGYHISSIEIAVHRTPRTAPLRFDPHFGLNAPLLRAGEDELFLWRALRRHRLRCRYIPLTVCTHPHISTGHRPPTPHTLKATGAIIALYYPLTAPLRIPLKAYRLWRTHHTPPLRATLHMLHGALHSTIILRTPWQK